MWAICCAVYACLAILFAPRRHRLRGVKRNKLPRPSRGNSRALGAGLTLAVTVALFAAGGQWLDTRLGTKPWLLLVCCCCGIVGGILHLIRVLAPEMWPFGKLPRNDPPPPAR
jgi:hypothetical protein